MCCRLHTASAVESRVEGLSLVGADMICPASEEIKGAASPDGVIWQEREDTPPLHCTPLHFTLSAPLRSEEQVVLGKEAEELSIGIELAKRDLRQDFAWVE